jgi:hypothetical protein
MHLIPPLPANAPAKMLRSRRVAWVVAAVAAPIGLVLSGIASWSGSSLLWVAAGLVAVVALLAFWVASDMPPVLWSHSNK